MKKILVPIDFSDCADNALVFAIQLAVKIQADIRVINIAALNSDEMRHPITVSLVIEEQKKEAKKLMKRSIKNALKKVDLSIDKIPIITANIEMGLIGPKICEAAIKYKSDFIVMGTQGAQNTLNKYLGSIAYNILTTAPCPVIVIPQFAGINEKMTLGYATNLQNADPFEIWKAGKLLNGVLSEIKCVHINEEQLINTEKTQELAAYFAEVAPNQKIAFHNLSVKDKVKGMSDFIENQNIHMLVMYKPQRNFFDSLFHRSFTKKMVLHINIPLMVIK